MAAGSIVFRSERDWETVGDLYVMDADGSNVRRVTEGGEFSVPAWAPDGKSIAFRQTSALEGAVGLLPAEGGAPVLLVTGDDPELRHLPITWAGDELLYGSRKEAEFVNLWIMFRSGGQQRQLFAPDPSGFSQSADVSRVDSRIVYVRIDRSGVPVESPSRDLWLAENAEDAEPENLTQGRVFAPSDPRWSPDGRRIAFAAYALAPDGSIKGHDVLHGSDAELFVLDVSTRELTRLTENDQSDVHPVWTPDGSHLVFSSGLDGSDEDIWMLSLDDPGQLVNLIEDTARPRADSMPDVLWDVPAD